MSQYVDIQTKEQDADKCLNFKNNYRTKICKDFLKKGFCLYGEKCSFFHYKKQSLF